MSSRSRRNGRRRPGRCSLRTEARTESNTGWAMSSDSTPIKSRPTMKRAAGRSRLETTSRIAGKLPEDAQEMTMPPATIRTSRPGRLSTRLRASSSSRAPGAVRITGVQIANTSGRRPSRAGSGWASYSQAARSIKRLLRKQSDARASQKIRGLQEFYACCMMGSKISTAPGESPSVISSPVWSTP